MVNTPDNIYGAFVFRRGLPHMFYLMLNGNIDTSHIIMTGRAINGTHAPECINTQSEGYYVMQLDETSGIVQSFNYVKSSEESPTIKLRLTDTKPELNDIVQQNDGSYKVTGSNPHITFKDLKIDPKKITDLVLSATPKHAYLLKQWDVYWTTESRPLYHMFHRHFFIFRDNTPENVDSGTITIPICQYPAFVFSDIIKDIRIRLPYRQGEIFILDK